MKMVFLFDFKIDKFPLIGKGKMLTTRGMDWTSGVHKKPAQNKSDGFFTGLF